MIDENDNINIDVETDRRLDDLAEANKKFREVEAKGLLPSQLKTNAQLVVPTSAPPPEVGKTSASPPEAGKTSVPLLETEKTSESRPVLDPDVAWRYTRLAITAGLVVLLFVVWIWQRKRGR